MSALVTRAVVAHISRQPQAHALADALDAHVFMDAGSLGEQTNHARALAWLAEADTPWVSMVEDDAVLCPDYDRVQADGLAHAPARHLVSEYLGTGRWAGTNRDAHERRVRRLVAHAGRTNQRWITADALWHAVCVTMPTEAATDALPYLGGRTPTDQALTTWARRTGWRVAYAWPSWVDHADTDSVAVHPDGQQRTQPRHAWRLVGA